MTERSANQKRIKMTQQNDPMPLKDLPGYIRSAREEGQGDYVPVVEMGQIITPRTNNWAKTIGYAAAACLLLMAGGLYATTSSIIVSIDNPQAIANIVADNGGKVFSVKQEENGTYKVRVFSLKIMSSLIEELRKNKDLKKVEAE
jgi:hypothetical protein